jgi:hypothetical protein
VLEGAGYRVVDLGLTCREKVIEAMEEQRPQIVGHAHPRRSGSWEQRMGRWVGVENPAVEDALEEILALLAAG